MRLWGNEGRSLMQLIHFSFSLGGLLSPLYAEPFLAPDKNISNIQLNTTHIAETTIGYNYSSDIYTQHLDNFTPLNDLSNQNFSFSIYNGTVTTTDRFSTETETNVHYAYLISSLIVFSGALPLLMMYIFYNRLNLTGARNKTRTSESFRELPQNIHAALAASLMTFLFLYACMEDMLYNFLMTFTVRAFPSVSKSTGAYITALLWASSAAARFSAIFVSQLVSPIRMLYLCGCLISVSFIGLPISSAVDSPASLAVFVATSGLGMAAVFATTFLWVESELTRVTPLLSACMFVSGSVGKMLNPVLLSFLLEEVANAWYTYMLIIYLIALGLLLTAILVSNRFYLNPRYGVLRTRLGLRRVDDYEM